MINHAINAHNMNPKIATKNQKLNANYAATYQFVKTLAYHQSHSTMGSPRATSQKSLVIHSQIFTPAINQNRNPIIEKIWIFRIYSLEIAKIAIIDTTAIEIFMMH